MDWRKLFLLPPKKRTETFKRMTRGEKWKVRMYNGALGACMGLTFGFPSSLLLDALRGQPETFSVGGVTWLLDRPTALGVWLVGVAIFIPVLIYVQRRLKQLHASSEWARSQGYTVDDL